MKKTFIRIIAALLIAMLALTLIPLSTFALDADYYYVYNNYVDSYDPSFQDFINAETAGQFETVDEIAVKNDSVSIDTDDYDDHAIWDGSLYDLQGVLVKYYTSNYDRDLVLKDGLTITDKNAADLMPYFDLIYTTHRHKLSYWYSDSTTHWRECLVCKHYSQFDEDFMYQNWHSDGDEDRVCDVCHADIPYHEVAVIETEGGKITVNEVEAPHRKKIVANVEAEEGYQFKKLHFTKIRDDGTRQEVTRRKNAEGFWTNMPTYDLEVSAEFIKK